MGDTQHREILRRAMVKAGRLQPDQPLPREVHAVKVGERLLCAIGNDFWPQWDRGEIPCPICKDEQ